MKPLYSLASTACLAALLLAPAAPAAAQAPAWQSAQAVAVATAASISSYSSVAATAVDAAGNVYVAGNFFNTVTMGGSRLTSRGDADVFVAKFSPASNQFVWAQRAGGTGADVALRLAVSGTSVYVAGYFNGLSAGFGPAALTSAGGADAYVAKLTDTGSTGIFEWAQRAGGTGDDRAFALAVSGTGVYVAGYFEGSRASFGPAMLASAGDADVFVAKLTDAGSTGGFVWAQRAGGTGLDVATALAVSGTSVYVAGDFEGSGASFGTLTLTSANAGNSTSTGFLASLADPVLLAVAAAGPRVPAALFPNPAHGVATLRLPAGTAPAPLLLSDAHGRVVRRYPAPAGPEATLDLGGLPAGLYLLRGAGPARRLAVE